MKKKYLNENNKLDAKKIGKFVENIYDDFVKMMREEIYTSENKQVEEKCRLIRIKLMDLYIDLYETPDNELV
jgi:hypothetical protein